VKVWRSGRVADCSPVGWGSRPACCIFLKLSCSVELVRHLWKMPEKFDIYSKIFFRDVENFVRHLCVLVLRHQMQVSNYFVNSFYSGRQDWISSDPEIKYSESITQNTIFNLNQSLSLTYDGDITIYSTGEAIKLSWFLLVRDVYYVPLVGAPPAPRTGTVLTHAAFSLDPARPFCREDWMPPVPVPLVPATTGLLSSWDSVWKRERDSGKSSSSFIWAAAAATWIKPEEKAFSIVAKHAIFLK
jgi:hypothetical protein